MLKQDMWYKIRTLINNREAVFRQSNALAMFGGVLNGWWAKDVACLFFSL
jgi:hypothetical protein